jgi:hypothetical protein
MINFQRNLSVEEESEILQNQIHGKFHQCFTIPIVIFMIELPKTISFKDFQFQKQFPGNFLNQED